MSNIIPGTHTQQIIHFHYCSISYLILQVKENEDGLFFFLVCLRVFPMSPNWFINMASPVLGIPIHYFFASVVLGKLNIFPVVIRKHLLSSL